MRAVDPAFHPVGVALSPQRLAQKNGDLSGRGLLRRAQALGSQRARYAVLFRALELDRGQAVDGAVSAVAVQPFAGRADAGLVLPVELEVLRLELAGLLRWRAALVVQRVGFGLVRVPAGITFIALTIAVVGDVSLDVVGRQLLEIGLGVITGIGGDDRLGGAEGCGGIHHGE